MIPLIYVYFAIVGAMSAYSDGLIIPTAFGQSVCDIASFRQKLDHDSLSSDVHFQQRYIICKDHWTAGGPLLFFTGSEGDQMVFVNGSGFVFEMAVELHGMVVFAEHRYYGQSIPFKQEELDADTMAWLTVDYALVDFKNLIQDLKRNITELVDSPVITIGGSYGGMLAAWMRLQYPDLITGALASSAPMLFVGFSVPVPCSAVAVALTEVYRAESQQCSDAIRRSWPALEDAFAGGQASGWLKKIFKSCTSEEMTSYSEMSGWMYLAFHYMAMTNYPYPSHVFSPLPAYPVKAACSYLSSIDANSSSTELLEAISKSISVYHNHTGTSNCLSFEFGATPSHWQEFQWRYQKCRDLFSANPTSCTDGVNDMFFPDYHYNATMHRDQCSQWTGVPVDPQRMLRKFGGDDLRNYTNVIFSNGKQDPLLPGGVGANHERPGISIILIDDAAHHFDLQASHPNDSLSLVRARAQEIEIIQGWLKPKSLNVVTRLSLLRRMNFRVYVRSTESPQAN